MPQVPNFYSDDCSNDDDESIECLLSWDMPGQRYRARDEATTSSPRGRLRSPQCNRRASLRLLNPR
jgi:hypothetical protein